MNLLRSRWIWRNIASPERAARGARAISSFFRRPLKNRADQPIRFRRIQRASRMNRENPRPGMMTGRYRTRDAKNVVSIQTNVASLEAQNYVNVNTNFQNNTIEQLSSGYRINSSGDDAAGLATANQYAGTIAT